MTEFNWSNAARLVSSIVVRMPTGSAILSERASRFVEHDAATTIAGELLEMPAQRKQTVLKFRVNSFRKIVGKLSNTPKMTLWCLSYF